MNLEPDSVAAQLRTLKPGLQIVTYLSAIREIVHARKKLENPAFRVHVSDYDLLCAPREEHERAIEIAKRTA